MNAPFIQALWSLALPYKSETQSVADMEDDIKSIQSLEKKTDVREIKSKTVLFYYNDVCIAEAFIANDAASVPRQMYARVLYCSSERLAEVVFQKRGSSTPTLARLLSQSESAKHMTDYSKHKPKSLTDTHSIVEFCSTNLSPEFIDEFSKVNNCTDDTLTVDTNDDCLTNIYELHMHADAFLFVLQNGVDLRTLTESSGCRTIAQVRAVRDFAAMFPLVVCTYIKHLRLQHKHTTLTRTTLSRHDYALLFSLCEHADAHIAAYVGIACAKQICSNVSLVSASESAMLDDRVSTSDVDNNTNVFRRGSELVHFFVSSAVSEWRKAYSQQSKDNTNSCSKEMNAFVYKCGVLHTRHDMFL